MYNKEHLKELVEIKENLKLNFFNTEIVAKKKGLSYKCIVCKNLKPIFLF